MAQNPRNNGTKSSTENQADRVTAVKNKVTYDAGQPLSPAQQFRKEKADARRERERLQQKAAQRQRLFTIIGMIVVIVLVVILGTVIVLNTSSSNINTSQAAATAPATAGATAGSTASAATTTAATTATSGTPGAAASDQGKVPPVSGQEITMPDGLKYIDITPGTGASPTNGQNVSVNYTGYLLDGTVFDSSYKRNQPFSFPIGTGQVIKGWDEGVLTMKVGGKRRLIIPPALGYGAQGAGSSIPPNSTLVFDIELLKVG